MKNLNYNYVLNNNNKDFFCIFLTSISILLFHIRITEIEILGKVIQLKLN